MRWAAAQPSERAASPDRPERHSRPAGRGAIVEVGAAHGEPKLKNGPAFSIFAQGASRSTRIAGAGARRRRRRRWSADCDIARALAAPRPRRRGAARLLDRTDLRGEPSRPARSPGVTLRNAARDRGRDPAGRDLRASGAARQRFPPRRARSGFRRPINPDRFTFASSAGAR